MSPTGSNCYQRKKKLNQTRKAKEGYFQGMRWWLCPISIVVVPLLIVQLFTTPWTAACLASLSFTISQSFLRFISIESVMLSNHLIFCCPLLCLQSFPASRPFLMSLLFTSGCQIISIYFVCLSSCLFLDGKRQCRCSVNTLGWLPTRLWTFSCGTCAKKRKTSWGNASLLGIGSISEHKAIPSGPVQSILRGLTFL